MNLLTLQNVGKAFRTYKSEWYRFARWLGIHTIPSEERWILRHINLNIHHGQAIGIIGLNGTGKSTLLKIIAGTLKPSEGTVQINGRVAAILELGMGFNMELTGRQNVRHNAGLMGFSREQIDAAISDIEAFADIAEYFDMPMRIYSSGMQVRVAFAVATAWQPDLLILDEALSVGDIYFQQKCLTKIRSMIADGASLILVSHDAQTIREFTQKALLISHDYFHFNDTNIILKEYEKQVLDTQKLSFTKKHITQLESTKELSNDIDFKNAESENVFINEGFVDSIFVEVFQDSSVAEREVVYGAGVNISIRINLRVPVDNPIVGIMIKDRLGRDVFCFDTDQYFNIKIEPASNVIDLKVNFKNTLVEGLYFISVSLVKKYLHSAAEFEHLYFISNVSHFYSIRDVKNIFFHGVCDLKPTIKISASL